MNKRILSIAFTLIASWYNGWAQPQSIVDERFELTSIAFRLAGANEYTQCPNKSYATDIDIYFVPYAHHELFEYIRSIRKESAIGYAAIPSTTAMLEIRNGKILLKAEFDVSDVPTVDKRWKKDQFRKYLKLLNDFYQESNFHQFFTTHTELYLSAEKCLNECLNETNFHWFESFFGIPLDPDLQIYASLSNGPNNYAFDAGILIGMNGNDQGEPVLSISTQYVILHELCHHYCNPIIFQYWSQMEDAANVIYPAIREPMAKSAYGSAKTTFIEWFTNLCVLMYYKELPEDHGMLTAQNRIMTEKGFIWMPRSVEFMNNFYNNRSTYLYVEDFMPQLVRFVNFTSQNFNVVQREFNQRRPYIKEVYPSVGSDITGVKAIKVVFSEPMRTDCCGIWNIEDPDIEFIPVDSENSGWIDEKTYVFSLFPDQLEKNRTYGFKPPVWAFRSEQDFALDDSYVNLIFNTNSK